MRGCKNEQWLVFSAASRFFNSWVDCQRKILFPILVCYDRALSLSSDPIKPLSVYHLHPPAGATFDPKAFFFKRSFAFVRATRHTSFVTMPRSCTKQWWTTDNTDQLKLRVSFYVDVSFKALRNDGLCFCKAYWETETASQNTVETRFSATNKIHQNAILRPSQYWGKAGGGN